MSISTSSPLGRTLAAAIAQVRRTVGDPVAPVVVLTPSEANGILARQQLALAGDFVRVELMTPERLVHELGRRSLAARGLRSEPTAWLSATIGALTRALAERGELGRYAEVLVQPGWKAALARAVETLEAAGVEPDALGRVALPEHAERLRILAALLRGVAARREVDRLYSTAMLCEAALPHAAADRRFAGAVVLGDRLLAPRIHAVLHAWLSTHPHCEVRPAPWQHLPPAPRGLRAATSGPVLDVLPEADTRLAALGRGLFGPRLAVPAVADDTVVLARTPDEVRELGEATRVVLDAIHDGTPLDRIAVVLPDAAQADVLRAHLAHAGVPATWLTGPPLATTPAARFLIHCLELANGDDTVPGWYDLLRQPGLRLRAAIDPKVTEGRGRWRKVLARCGAVRRTDAIVRAVEAWAAGVDEEAFDPEGDRRSALNLVRAIEALEAVFVSLRQPGTLGEHARRWDALLRTWWSTSADRARVQALLSGWGSPGTGAPLPLGAAIGELRDALQSTPALHGSLSDPAIRIVSPMSLLGGAFDVVVATGLSENRLPRHPNEDPLLPDALLHAINDTLGTTLVDSRDLGGFEARRFAAIVASCTGRLWLSSPATELLEDRPFLPSTFVLDVASVLLGQRARYRDLDRMMQRFGSRARPWPDQPDRAVGPLEHRVANTAAEPEAGLRRLATHPTARRLLGLHRALGSDAPTPWTGLLTPGILPVPGLDGEPLRAKVLTKLLKDPGAFMVDEVLGVRRAPRLYRSSDPTRATFQDQMLLDALEQALDAPGPLPAAFAAAWDTLMADWLEHRVDVTDDIVALARSMTMVRFEQLRSAGAIPAGRPLAASGQPVEDLPWVVDADEGRIDTGVVTALRKKKPARDKLARDVPELVLGSMVDPAVTELRVAGLDGKTESADLDAETDTLATTLQLVTRCVEGGWWPWGARGDLVLTAESLTDYADTDVIDAALETTP